MRRIVIYARGKLLKNNLNKIDWREIVAIVDKTAKDGETFENIPVVLPECLKELQYDYIAIFSKLFFKEIQSDLSGSYFVPIEKIISWKPIVNTEIHKWVFLEFLKEYMNSCKIQCVLDRDNSFLFEHFLTKESLSEELVRLDGIGAISYPIMCNLYDHVYDKLSDVDIYNYDVTLLWNIPDEINEVKEILNKSNSCLLMIDYITGMKVNQKELKEWINRYAEVKIFQNCDGWIWEIRRKRRQVSVKTHIYVVTHKEYNSLNNDLYKPICVGNSYENNEFLSEKTGDNISYLNEKINECTALYWIWKNTTDKYVGLNHYRRYFCDNHMQIYGNYLQQETIEEILTEYDIVLACIHINKNTTVLGEIRGSVTNDEVYEKGYWLVRNGIKQRQPDYLEAFDCVMNGHREYICNLFVTKHEILDLYCEWLFSFLIDIAEEIDVNAYDNSSKRIIGFFAERMWTVWLFKQNLKIKELPFIMQ